MPVASSQEHPRPFDVVRDELELIGSDEDAGGRLALDPDHRVFTTGGDPVKIALGCDDDGVDAAEDVTGPYDVIVRADDTRLRELCGRDCLGYSTSIGARFSEDSMTVSELKKGQVPLRVCFEDKRSWVNARGSMPRSDHGWKSSACGCSCLYR